MTLNCLLKRHKLLSSYYSLIRTFRANIRKSQSDKILICQEEDVMDEFITQLKQRKSDKWDRIATKRIRSCHELLQKKNDTHEINDDFTLQPMETEEINTLVKSALEEDNYEKVVLIIKQCIVSRTCPSINMLIQVLSLLSQNGDKTMILEIHNYCERLHPKILNNNANFQHYLAEATWIKGNISRALVMFDQVYRTNVYLRRHIRLMLKYLILDLVSNKSEAALINLIEFCERLVNDYKDYYPLACVWQLRFLSEWYTDQCLAVELLDRKRGLCKAVINRLTHVIIVSLKSHQTEPVYRVLEILLKYEMKEQYSLFNYRFHQGDLESFREIVQWSLNHDVTLPMILHEKFLHLLLKFKFTAGGKVTDTAHKSRTQSKPYNLKF